MVREGRGESSSCPPLSARATLPECRSYGTNHSAHIETSPVDIEALPVSQCRAKKRVFGTSQDHPDEGIANAIVSARRKVINAVAAYVRSMAVLVRKATVSFATQVNMLLTLLCECKSQSERAAVLRRGRGHSWRQIMRPSLCSSPRSYLVSKSMQTRTSLSRGKQVKALRSGNQSLKRVSKTGMDDVWRQYCNFLDSMTQNHAALAGSKRQGSPRTRAMLDDPTSSCQSGWCI